MFENEAVATGFQAVQKERGVAKVALRLSKKLFGRLRRPNNFFQEAHRAKFRIAHLARCAS